VKAFRFIQRFHQKIGTICRRVGEADRNAASGKFRFAVKAETLPEAAIEVPSGILNLIVFGLSYDLHG
jgi:hypothetical protein